MDTGTDQDRNDARCGPENGPCLAAGRFTAGGSTVELTESEASLLACLLEAGHRVVSRSELTRALWGTSSEDTGRAVDTHIHRLRKKLAQIPGVRISTIRSRGFRLEYTEKLQGDIRPESGAL